MLEIRGVRKEYGKEVAVRDVSLTVGEAEFVTLLGPSGSGKSTILGMVAGFHRPDGGSIVLDGRDVKHLSAAERGIGVVFQDYALFPHMSVAENIAYGLRRRRWNRDRIAARVAEMLALIGMDAYGKRRPAQLSGGQQQRVALARALAFEPAVLLMDEPLGALDREIRAQMQEEIRRIHQELRPSILYVTHNKEEAFALSDRVGIMRAAELVALGTPSELYERPTTAFVAGFFAGRQVLDGAEVGSIDRVRGEAAVRIGGVAAVADVAESLRDGQGEPKLAIRSELVEVGDGAVDEAGFAAVVRAQVTGLSYMGGTTVVQCALEPDGEVLRAEIESAAARRLHVGQQVRVGLRRHALLVVRA